MTLKSQIQSDIAGLFYNTDDFAETITYTQTGKSGISIPAIPDYSGDSGGLGADEWGDNATIRIKASDISLPSTGDTVQSGADVYEVLTAHRSDCGLEWILWIVKKG